MKVLVVDDELSILSALEDVLGSEGHDVATATNGQRGLETARSFRPDVILLDVMMPVLDGREMLTQVREREDDGLRRTPVILMSAGPRPPEQTKYAVPFLSKPFELDHLLDTLERLSPSPAGPAGRRPG